MRLLFELSEPVLKSDYDSVSESSIEILNNRSKKTPYTLDSKLHFKDRESFGLISKSLENITYKELILMVISIQQENPKLDMKNYFLDKLTSPKQHDTRSARNNRILRNYLLQNIEEN